MHQPSRSVTRFFITSLFALSLAAGPAWTAEDDENDNDDKNENEGHPSVTVPKRTKRGELAKYAGISIDEALRAGRDAVTGVVVGVELENDDGGLVYEMEIVEPDGTVTEVEIDAGNGKILEIERED